MTKIPKLITAIFSEISMDEAKRLLDEHRLEKLLLVDEDYQLKGLISSKDIENLEKYPLANKDTNGQLRVGAAIGRQGVTLSVPRSLIRLVAMLSF